MSDPMLRTFEQDTLTRLERLVYNGDVTLHRSPSGTRVIASFERPLDGVPYTGMGDDVADATNRLFAKVFPGQAR